jgi:hypothetical protein
MMHSVSKADRLNFTAFAFLQTIHPFRPSGLWFETGIPRYLYQFKPFDASA